MRLFLISLTLLVTGAALSVTALVTSGLPFTSLGTTCTAFGVLVAVINNRKDTSDD